MAWTKKSVDDSRKSSTEGRTKLYNTVAYDRETLPNYSAIGGARITVRSVAILIS